MNRAFAFAVLAFFVSAAARAQPVVRTQDPDEQAPDEQAPDEQVPDGGAAPAAHKRVEGDNGKIGVALLAGGAVLATGTAAGVTLLQAVTHPDDDRNKPAYPEVVQVSGFVTVTLASLSAGLMIVGGALLLDDTLEP